MTKEQEIFWNEIRYIQETITGIYLTKSQKYNNMEDLLNDVTYDTICSLMEILDGVGSKDFRGDIIFLPSGDSINSNYHMLHDDCEDYLNCSEI